ncbi:MAG TPA: hypothetical protein VFZ15_01855 [Acidimicrobiia bacterium]|nr:hypothetical protein [Acidimicrobiia bacterium]
MIPLLIAIAVIAAGFAVYWLLVRVTARGGEVPGDAARMAAQILAEADGFRGSRSEGSTPWDGHNRLAPPTQDSGSGSGGS